MIKDNQKHFNRLHVVIDGLIIAVSYILAWYIQIHLIVKDRAGTLPVQIYMLALVFVIPGFLLLYYGFNLYTPKRVQGRRLEASNIFCANAVGVLLIMFVLYMVNEPDFSRPLIFIFAGINYVLTVIERNVIRALLRDIRRRGMNLKHILMVGYSRAAEEFIDRVVQNPQWGYQVNGILDDSVRPGTLYKNVKVVGSTSSLEKILEHNSLDEIAITLGLNEYYKLKKIVATCEKSGVHTKFIPDYYDIIPTRPYTEDLQGLPVINIRHVPLTNTFNMMVKRVMDIVGSILCIIIFSPLMLLTAVLIKATSKGPVIYAQVRVGLHNQPFKMYKFRSMEVQSPSEEKKGWTTKNDPRVTPIGKIIRRTSIDEFPQLFNVLKGCLLYTSDAADEL